MNIDEITNQISKLWEDRKGIREIIMHTGKGGAILARISLVKELVGLSEEEEDKLRKQLDLEYEDGIYEIGGEEYIKYLGLFDKDQPDGLHLYKTKDNRWRVDEWLGGKRVHYNYITSERANDILKDPNTKEI